MENNQFTVCSASMKLINKNNENKICRLSLMLSSFDNWITCARFGLLTISSINIVISCITTKINRQNNNNLITCSSMLYLFFMGETRVWYPLYIWHRRRYFHFLFILLPCIQGTVFACRYRFTTTSQVMFHSFLFLLEPRTVCWVHAILDPPAMTTWQPLPLRT